MMNRNYLSNLYPITKLIFIISIAAIGMLAEGYLFSYVVILPILLLLAFLDGKLISYSKKMYKMLLFLAITIFFIKGLFHTSEDIMFSFWIINLKTQGIYEAIDLISVIICIAGSLLLFFETTDLEDFMVSLVKLKMPYVGAYVFLATLQMIPDFGKRSKVIMQAQRARGIETEGNLFIRVKAFIPMLSPLIISSITEIEDNVITLESRAFSVEGKRVFLIERNIKKTDYLVGIAAIALLIGFIIWRYIIWTL